MTKKVILYGLTGGVLLAFLEFIESKLLVREYTTELYGGLVALLFTVLGIYLGLKWTRAQQVVIVKEVPVPEAPFVLNAANLKDLGITQREHQILGLIAQGLSNREIAETLFVSENTVKTHSSRLFDKMAVNRRIHAVQKAKDLRLVP